MYLTGKPRSRLSTHLGEYIVKQQTEINFDIIAYPAPYGYHVWSARSPKDNHESLENEANRFINISCKIDTVRGYLSTCTLTVSNTNSQSNGLYKVQVINEAGDENFTVILTFRE